MIHQRTTWLPRCGEVGLLSAIFSEADPRTAQEQANTNYAHGGGWHSFEGFTLAPASDGKIQLEYAGDPPIHELSRASFRDQTLVLFEYAWVGIIDNKSGELLDVSRMD